MSFIITFHGSDVSGAVFGEFSDFLIFSSRQLGACKSKKNRVNLFGVTPEGCLRMCCRPASLRSNRCSGEALESLLRAEAETLLKVRKGLQTRNSRVPVKVERALELVLR